MAVIEERISSGGKKSYRVKVRLRGFPPQNATFEKITDARRWEQDTESAIREGRYFKTAKAKKHTVKDNQHRQKHSDGAYNIKNQSIRLAAAS